MITQMIDLRTGHIVDVYSYGIRFGWRILWFIKEYGTYEVFDSQTQKWYTATSKNLYPVNDESIMAWQMLEIKKALIGDNIAGIKTSTGHFYTSFAKALRKQIEINRTR